MTIFAKVAVDLLDHQRVLRIPRSVRASCLGAWLAALIYSRKHELDGFCPADVVDVIAGEDVLEWLVKVELIARDEKDGAHGFRVLRYEQHNETKAEIEKRRRADRKRKANGAPAGRQEESAARPRGFRQESGSVPTARASGIPGSDSGSGSGSETGERERAPAPPRLTPVPPPPPGPGDIRLTDKLPAELRAAAGITGVRDIDGAWSKFVGHHNGRRIDTLPGGLAGAWQVWCVNERKREQAAPAHTSGPGLAPVSADSPAHQKLPRR